MCADVAGREREREPLLTGRKERQEAGTGQGQWALITAELEAQNKKVLVFIQAIPGGMGLRILTTSVSGFFRSRKNK